MNYRAEIDGLRGWAVLSVIIFHAFPSWLKGGFIGVDIFFVISGFLITSYIFENLSYGHFSFFNFFGRRIRRIFPALILVMFSSLIFGWFFLFTEEFTQLSKHVAGGAAFISNFILINESGYFDNAANTKPMLHLWSLAIEEQFYIFWPIILWLAWLLKLNLLTISFSVAAISFFFNLFLIKLYPTEVFFLPLGRFWELLSGGILAWFYTHKSESLFQFKHWVDSYFLKSISVKGITSKYGSKFLNLISFLGLLLLIYGFLRIEESFSFPSFWALIPVTGTVLVIVSGSKAILNRLFFMNPIIVWIGIISYPLYLWHWPILTFLQIIDGGMPNMATRAIALVASIILAWVTYYLIEKPIRRFGKWGVKTLILICLLAFLGFLSLIIYETKGRFLPITPKQIIANTAYASPMRDGCHFPLEKDFEKRNVCKYFQDERMIAVFGNSHSVELAYAMALILKDLGLGVEHHTMSGCEHNFGLTNLNDQQQICADWESSVVEKIKLDASIKSIVVSYRNETYLNEKRKALANMLDVLVKSNKEVVLVLQAPLPKMHINSHIRKSVFNSKSNVKGHTKEEWFKIYNAKVDLLKEISKKVKVYDPTDVFCDQLDCYVVKSGVALYFDDDHMSVKGSEMVAQEVLKLISIK